MESIDIKSVVIIGAGNVAWHLSKRIKATGFTVKQVYSRSLENAQELAIEVGAQAISNLEDVADDADLYIISVSDSVVAEMGETLSLKKGIICHTAGSLSIDLLSGADRYAVLYPMQTFSKQKAVDVLEVPFFIEASDDVVENTIRTFAETLSSNVSHLTSEQRLKLHVSAVFACNFVNHLFVQASDVLKDIGQDFSLLQPLIEQTFEKALQMPPEQGQTGPAVRKDMNVVNKHIAILENNKNQQELYKMLSESIIKRSGQ